MLRLNAFVVLSSLTNSGKVVGEKSKKEGGQDEEVFAPRVHQSGCQRVAGILEGAHAGRKDCKAYEAYKDRCDRRRSSLELSWVIGARKGSIL
jgi:hypothetical protein